MEVDTLPGKTVAAVATREMYGRDLHYKEDVLWTEHVLTFTDGSTFTITESSDVELDGDTIMERTGLAQSRDWTCSLCETKYDAGQNPLDTGTCPEALTTMACTEEPVAHGGLSCPDDCLGAHP